ncbi:MAG: hypothetical protein EA402_04465 [Planctomycetota bacterium]|nr:MAG: hypothetical protein EA402_04465 [Planctomycetota bacterium]
METFERLYDLLVVILDYPLGWMLYLGRDLSIFTLAAGTALVMLLLRRRVSNQAALAMASEDRATLKQRQRAAKKAGQRDLARRLGSERARLALSMLRHEGKPLLAALIPIILLASWAYARLGHIPPTSDSVVSVHVDLAPGMSDTPVYLLPADGVEAVNGWIQFPEPAEAAFGGEAVARAVWDLRFAASEEPYRLTLHAGDAQQYIDMIVDQRIYANPERYLYQATIRGLFTQLEERRFLGLVPGIPGMAIPPWLLAYLLLAIPCYLIFKKLLRIH